MSLQQGGRMKEDDMKASPQGSNVWTEVCARRGRPPRIGDIPKHSAVDEESPCSEAQKLDSASPEARALTSDRLSPHGVGVNPPKTSPAHETASSTSEEYEDCSLCGWSGSNRPPVHSFPASAETIENSHNPSCSQQHARRRTVDLPKVSSFLTGLPGTSWNPSHPDRGIRSRPSLTSVPSTNSSRNLIRLSSSPSQEIREVRKDSALYLEEEKELQNFRETIKVRSSRSSTPRRESSGYASLNLGTFDEERRTSEVDLATHRERRRSSTKRPTFENLVKISSTSSNSSSRGEDSLHGRDEKMPTMEIHRKVSSSGLEMPDIQEFKDAEYEATFGLGQLRLECDDAITQTPMGDSLIKHKFPNAPLTFERSDSFDDESSADQENKAKPIIAVDPVVTEQRGLHDENRLLSGRCRAYADIFAKSFASSSKPKTSLMKQLFPNAESPRNVPQDADPRRRKTVVHQYSTPNFPTEELKSILEKPIGKLPKRTREQKARGKSMKRIIRPSKGRRKASGKNGPDLETEPTDDDESSGNEVITWTLLPRPVKVYQLLSTRSEDCADEVYNLADRRISLQIPKREDVPLPVTKSHSDERTPLCSESVPLLVVPDMNRPESEYLDPTKSERLPTSESSSLDETRASQSQPKETRQIGGRPVHPYCPYSPYGSPQGSPRMKRRPLRECRRVSIDNKQGSLQLNQYKLSDNIGQGSFGIVKLAYNEDDGTYYAMKILSKKKLMKKAGIFGRIAPSRRGSTNPLAKVYGEIALLKKLDHPNVVKLIEVLDDPDEDNLYLVFELVQRGEVLQLPTDRPLDEETARIHFRDIVLGVEYLHYQRIVHRDIKPSNLLVDAEGRVKVADLGVSAELRASGELLSGPAGTPAFAAPETTIPGAQYSGTLCDVWSMGVTLYSLVTGKVPWDGAGSISAVQDAVRMESLKFPYDSEVSDPLRDLISRMLVKDPAKRLTIPEIKKHPWLTKNGTEMLPSEEDNCQLPVTVTDEEVASVVTRVPKLDTLILIKTMLKQHSFQLVNNEPPHIADKDGNELHQVQILNAEALIQVLPDACEKVDFDWYHSIQKTLIGCTKQQIIVMDYLSKLEMKFRINLVLILLAHPFLAKRNAKLLRSSEAHLGETFSCPASESSPTSNKVENRTEKFHQVGRSNSAPDTYDWRSKNSQEQLDSPLSPVTEAFFQEIEAEKRMAYQDLAT